MLLFSSPVYGNETSDGGCCQISDGIFSHSHFLVTLLFSFSTFSVTTFQTSKEFSRKITAHPAGTSVISALYEGFYNGGL